MTVLQSIIFFLGNLLSNTFKCLSLPKKIGITLYLRQVIDNEDSL